MIRFSVVKLGSRLDEIKDVPGSVEWNDKKRKEEKIVNEVRNHRLL